MGYADFFKVGKSKKVKARSSTIRHTVFKNLIPWIEPCDAEIKRALELLEMSDDDVRCVYCGGEATTLDHIYASVDNKKPTGYTNEIANLVPCCQTCNASRGNKPWKEWLLYGKSPKAPRTRGVRNLEEKANVIENYIRTMKPQKISIKELLGDEKYNECIKKMEEVIEMLDCLDGICMENQNIVRNKINEKRKQSKY